MQSLFHKLWLQNQHTIADIKQKTFKFLQICNPGLTWRTFTGVKWNNKEPNTRGMHFLH